MTVPGTFPTFAELLAREGNLAGTSWGLFPEPGRGTPSFITPAALLEARNSIRSGTVFGLDYPADAFDPGMSLKRSAPRHTIYSSHPAHRDDYLDGYYLQGSTQIDGLRHRRADDVGFYDGVPDHRITEGTPDLGIQEWAEHPIAGRGVLVDLDGFRNSVGEPIDHAGGEPLGLDLLQAAMESQSLTTRPGDILLLHTGWCEWFLALDPEEKQRLRESRKATGVAQSQEFVAWAWDSRFAVIAADTFAVECLPAVPDSPYRESAFNDHGMMHQQLLAKLGMPLGELWRLGPLARHMRSTATWDAFISIKPLNITGGTGSPANATAIM
ncbi:cyclase family protein [Pseudarthrobacter niigatensis]|uniref:Kynurenine formamidase n=1 Tax=Pseudarthrobacter niigatensis TaxID=369935 RepID=A0AAJ1SX47_9MICC|nr:cyclase family protein [Pseudarthrobacter niigatensis]MDQ0147789.1 kynurenine formamidase [Pseudarthrobacter niigatensis]MDQ0267729.1 kynurenine formamidase [Pseudarthrobacter niigatensis]